MMSKLMTTIPSITFSNTEYRRKVVAELIKMYGGYSIESKTFITYYNEDISDNNTFFVMAQKAEREVEVALCLDANGNPAPLLDRQRKRRSKKPTSTS